MRGTWETTDSGGGDGLLKLATVIVGLAVLASSASAIVAIVNALLVVLGAVVGLAVAAGTGLLVWRLRQSCRPAALPWEPGILSARQRPAVASPEAASKAIEATGGKHWHLHFHGLSAEDVAAAIIRRGLP